MNKDDHVERLVTVKPINSGCEHLVFPVESCFTQLVQSQCSTMFFVGQIVSFWRYPDPVEIEVSPIDLDKFLGSESSEESQGILTKSLKVIKSLHFRNRIDRNEQLKDFGKIIWLLEKYKHRLDHFCPECSELIPLRFPDIFDFCGKCGSKLELSEYLPPRFRTKKTCKHGGCDGKT